jgi:glutamate synthase (NADPH/NADH) small chain
MQKIPGGELAIDRRARVNQLVIEPEARRPEERICDFEPTFLSLTPEEAQAAAECCIHCPDPALCYLACPAKNDIPSAMWLIEQGKFAEAADLYHQTSSLPEICGRVCPHEALCMGACIRNKQGDPVLTGRLEAFVTDYERQQGAVEVPVGAPTGKRVAVVGSGPSGLACADRLVQKGHSVTIFERDDEPGGLLMHGIPNFKLPKSVVKSRIQDFVKAGVEFKTGSGVGPDLTLDDLFDQGFDAIYLAVGANVDADLEVPGADLPGVIEASEFLRQANRVSQDHGGQEPHDLTSGQRVVVIGGGDTAADCLRTAIRMKADSVTCLYRRTEAEMPGSKKDRHLAEEEGAAFQFLTQPVRFISGEDGRVAQVECLACQLGAPDSSGRRRPVPVEGSNFTVDADTVILAVGYWPDPTLGEANPDLKTRNYGLIIAVRSTGATTLPGVFAGGDAVTGPDLVVTAMAAGHRAAAAIDEYLGRGSAEPLGEPGAEAVPA